MYAWKVYSGLILYGLLLARVMPGYMQEGLPFHLSVIKLSCRSFLGLLYTHHRCGLAPLQHLSPNGDHRQLWPHHDRRHNLGLCCILWNFLLDRRTWGTNAYVWQLHIRRIHGCRTQPSYWSGWFEDVDRGPRPLGNFVFLAVSGAYKQYEQYVAVTPVCSAPCHSQWISLSNCHRT